ncbi:ABC transporter ATP-binding protein [Metamycoplasma hominis]|uniref:ABC transporter ATP-binding protein n=1 Tax=Metamycoplasma hominis TaxID=2098 RepID=UPI0015943335|nr:ABC transporter ATP-binding protein [Metamycoplasma hominis]QKX36887.1 ABC transporter ATP-binding protein [Metamycoplasma hominis]
MDNHILELKNVVKIYNKSDRGIHNISYAVESGNFHAFIGENGAGKTTTIKTIIGSYINFKGEILIGGITNLNPNSKKILGYVPENAVFPKELTTYEYLKALALLSGINKTEVKAKIESYLQRFGIIELKNEKPANFSSGQKKKVLLIQALINEPKLLILDEPAANLDPTARFELFSILHELNKKGTTIFISSHVLSEIDKYANSLTLIHGGKILYSGPKYDSLEKIFYEKVIKN